MSSQYWYYLLDRIIGLEKHERITEDAQARMLKEAVQTSYRRGGEETTQTQLKSRRIMCTQCQGHLVFYFPNIWTLSFMEFQDSYNEFCRIKKFVQ